MYIEIPKLCIRFIDSLNFIQKPLKDFPKTFNIIELKKGYFPHYFNKKCHENYVGQIPSKKHYGVDQMYPDKRSKFFKWYNDRISENYVFDFRKELIEYCRSDVDILRRSMTEFRKCFIETENIDPLRYVTITSVCVTIYRNRYMSSKTIAIVSEAVDHFNKMSVIWLSYMSKKGIHIEKYLNKNKLH